MFELNSGEELFPLIEFYSKDRETSIEVLKPRLYRTTELAGTDTIIRDSTVVNKSITIATKKHEDTSAIAYKFGNISGEAGLFKFDITNNIPEDATIVTGWLSLDNVGEDSIYGGISEITLHEILDDNWINNGVVDSLVYDLTSNVFSQSVDSNIIRVKDIENLLRKWQAEPEENYGFYIVASDRMSSAIRNMGYSLFTNLKFEITYMLPPEE